MDKADRSHAYYLAGISREMGRSDLLAIDSYLMVYCPLSINETNAPNYRPDAMLDSMWQVAITGADASIQEPTAEDLKEVDHAVADVRFEAAKRVAHAIVVLNFGSEGLK